jgi:hypothetical protein
MFLFYVLTFFKKGVTIQGGTLFKESRLVRKMQEIRLPVHGHSSSSILKEVHDR